MEILTKVGPIKISLLHKRRIQYCSIQSLMELVISVTHPLMVNQCHIICGQDDFSKLHLQVFIS